MRISNLLRNFAFFPCIAFFAGCGFQPLYVDGKSKLGAVEIAPIEGRIGYLVQNELRSKLGENGQNPKHLTIKISTNYSNASVSQTAYTTRNILTASVNYKLEGDGIKPIIGSFSENTGYDVVSAPYGEVSFAKDSEDKLAVKIADRIWLDILSKSQ